MSRDHPHIKKMAHSRISFNITFPSQILVFQVSTSSNIVLLRLLQSFQLHSQPILTVCSNFPNYTSWVDVIRSVSPQTCYAGYCYNGTARPQVEVGGDALHIWTVVANIISKESRKPDKG